MEDFQITWAVKKGTPGYFGFMGDEMLPRYVGILINHHKDPY